MVVHISGSLQEVRWNSIQNVSSHKDVAETQVEIQGFAQPTVGNVDHAERGDAEAWNSKLSAPSLMIHAASEDERRRKDCCKSCW